MQRLVVARFHRHDDADGYLQILRQLLPTTKHVIVFGLVQKASNYQD
ncbi:hypothetical protein [Nostoc sp. 106C]|nr:hypothetical protein [Nostoc sp. 106C]